MNIRQIDRALEAAGVPFSMHLDAIACLAEARRRARGLLAHKIKARLMAKRIARALPWDAETIEQIHPQWASYGVVPNLGNGVNGDNIPWAEHYRMPDGSTREVWHYGAPGNGQLPEDLRAAAEHNIALRRRAALAAGGIHSHNAPCTRPLELDTDPDSLSYRTACARNYWGHRFFSGGAGQHPRSIKARTAWLRSNGGEREAWNRGMPVSGAVRQWQSQQGKTTVTVFNQDQAWQINIKRRLLGRWFLHWRLGFEIDNAIHAHPRPGFDKRAPVTWGWRPERQRKAT
ncbi:hypothetical protein CLI92_09315 [Vandammella animalimorsus]|uniref:Uncharacterized protein n=1 Tax=Vandammella animalimorsus TaxID=2029117 RepID=A0A2A2T519_9BURK|nr:hypothetical protein [Vandammella animalimorsus]PAT30690.1 hypothetical protein CK626_14045 [Vandammella animalimorsus]PAX16518.1 hypothetical protein CLI92_09315 [Vandammella animalimorsus]PAX18933.1 hypothetical protein CLI93_11395 [Vandammella animalimorsus]